MARPKTYEELREILVEFGWKRSSTDREDLRGPIQWDNTIMGRDGEVTLHLLVEAKPNGRLPYACARAFTTGGPYFMEGPYFLNRKNCLLVVVSPLAAKGILGQSTS